MTSLDDVARRIELAVDDLTRAHTGAQVVTQELVNFRQKMNAVIASGFTVAAAKEAFVMAERAIKEVDALGARITEIMAKTGESLG